MRLVHCLLITISIAACGDDGGSGGATAAAGPRAAAAAAKPGAALRLTTRVEDRATTEHEKLSIRHVFKERDFGADQNRDPFQPFIITLQGLGPEALTAPQKVVANCEQDKMQASGYSYTELKLVGIVQQGTQRKALVMGGNLGYIIKRLDCVGKEKAIVDEISDGFVRLRIKAEPTQSGAPDRPAETHEMELHPKELAMGTPVEPGRMPPVPDVPGPYNSRPNRGVLPKPPEKPAPAPTPTPAPVMPPPTDIKP